MSETAGQRIKRKRMELGYKNQRQFAQLVGMAQSTLSEIERGESQLPSAKNMKKLCEVLQVSDAWIIYGTDEQLHYPTEQESAVLSALRRLTAEEQRAVYAIINSMAAPRKDD